ncbi:MAG: phosphoribosyl-AMP cyclohydrolase, partial [Lentisphaeria bacterium]
MFEPDFDKSSDGLIPVIVQDSTDNRVLMLAYVNREAWQRSLTTKTATYWSRSRQKLWVKGETSGNTQIINDILIDCDQDTVIFKVTQQGAG